ncbi:MAG: YicC family protein [Firmicutes bacterium]|nr:YicC family protein [Bacillota bacterium]
MRSMTGYGLGEAQSVNYSIVVEMRSVNHRYLEISLRLPRQLNMLEDALKKMIQTKLSRGKVDVYLALERFGGKKIDLILDKELAFAYYNSLIQLSELTGVPHLAQAEKLADFPGVLTQETGEDDLDEITVLSETALAKALTSLIEMRDREGYMLKEDILARMQHVSVLLCSIKEAVPQLLAEQQAKLRKRIEELLEDIKVDEARLANEIAFLVDRTDISEELTRLASHCQQFIETSELPEAMGRRLDFLVQELNREVNTIGSKSNTLIIGNLVIEMKNALEKIREQVQNIE